MAGRRKANRAPFPFAGERGFRQERGIYGASPDDFASAAEYKRTHHAVSEVKRHKCRAPAALSLSLAAMALLLAGCKSGSMSSCVSPCVAGRVVAADTGQPLAGAKVHRVNATQNVDEPAKGGQLMQDTTPVAVADEDGKFVLDAEMALTPFIHRDFYSVTISFEHPGYLALQTNYTTFNVNGRTPEGAPKVNTGDIGLKPSR